MRGGAFFDSEAKFSGHKRLDSVEEKVVELGTRLAPDLDGVLEALRRDQSGARAFALKQRVRADRRAMEEDEIAVGLDLLYCVDNGLRGVVRRRENFQHAQTLSRRIDPDAVGEGAPSVDGDAQRLGRTGHGIGELA